TEAARSKMKPEEFEFFKKDMQNFETRMQNNPQETAKTFREIRRLLEPEGQTMVDAKHMKNLAIDVMHHAAEPKSVSQDIRNTCSVAALESRIYTRHPSDAAKLVADMATKGSFTTADGANNITLDKQTVGFYPDFWRKASLAENYD